MGLENFGIGSEFLMGVAGSIFKSEELRWVVKNRKILFRTWAAVTLVLFFILIFWGLAADPKDSWWAAKFTALKSPSGWSYGNFISVTFWTLFYTLLFEFVPFFFMLLPLAIVSFVLWVVIYIVGSMLIFLFGPLLVFAGARLLFFHYAAMWLRSSDQLDTDEQAVTAALRLGEGARHWMDGRARLMEPGEFSEFQKRPQKGAETLVGKVEGEWFSYATEKHVLVVAGTRGGKGRDLEPIR